MSTKSRKRRVRRHATYAGSNRGPGGEARAFDLLNTHRARLALGASVTGLKGRWAGMTGKVVGRRGAHTILVRTPDGLDWEIEDRNLAVFTGTGRVSKRRRSRSARA